LEVMRNKIRQLARYYEAFPQSLQVAPPVITLGSAADLTGIPENSVDYVFTDPPFGSNIFYADCNLITESWLGGITRVEDEAVVNRTLSAEDGGKSLSEYGELLTKALSEAYRVLKPKGWMTMVFHNTDPKVWATIQAAAQSAGFDLVGAGSLDRKQMSHKGYKGRSGEENVAHFDVVMSLRKANLNKTKRKWDTAPTEYIEGKVETLLKMAPNKGREQWIHSELIQALVSDGYDLGSISFSDVSRLISPTSPATRPQDTA
jgi:adenine-specific DNA methylase